MNSTKFEMTACRMFVQWPREVGAMGGGCKRPGGTFQGAAFFKEDKNVRPVYGHLNALQLSIHTYIRKFITRNIVKHVARIRGGSVTLKMHQIHIRPGLRPICTLGSSAHSLVSWELGQGGAAGRTFAPGITDPRAATAWGCTIECFHSHY